MRRLRGCRARGWPAAARDRRGRDWLWIAARVERMACRIIACWRAPRAGRIDTMLEGFEPVPMTRDGVALQVRVAGQGAPLLLLHGHPQSQAMWHRVAPQLAQNFSLVLMDLRGYGDSGRPVAGDQSINYSRREMALDA